jgi:hypothetical protein
VIGVVRSGRCATAWLIVAMPAARIAAVMASRSRFGSGVVLDLM